MNALIADIKAFCLFLWHIFWWASAIFLGSVLGWVVATGIQRGFK